MAVLKSSFVSIPLRKFRKEKVLAEVEVGTEFPSL